MTDAAAAPTPLAGNSERNLTSMRRVTFDRITSAVGLLLAVILLVAGGLLLWAYSFVNTQVQQQLTEQQIVFPATGSAALKTLPAADAAAMSAYAGQLMTTGAQAKTYADHFIAVHLKEIGGGKTYSQLSAESLAQPGNAALKAQVDTIFQGTTLRGLLLEAYAFATIGMIMLWAAIAAFAAALVMSVLVGVGLWHASRTAEETELMGRQAITTA